MRSEANKAKIEDPIDLIAGLPGESLIREEIAEVRAGRRTAAACLISIARPRFSRAGLLLGIERKLLPEAELSLYRLLRALGGEACSKYNALLRELVSFENALDWRMQKNSTSHGRIPS